MGESADADAPGMGGVETPGGTPPNCCTGSQVVPFDTVLGIAAYQQTPIELIRLGCLLAVFLPFELAVNLLAQLCGIRISNDTLWRWVQQFGRQGMNQLASKLENLAKGIEPMPEPLGRNSLIYRW